MIYATRARAQQVADQLNKMIGQPVACVIIASYGWAIVRSYAYGITGR
jgi:hypothetical protein